MACPPARRSAAPRCCWPNPAGSRVPPIRAGPGPRRLRSNSRIGRSRGRTRQGNRMIRERRMKMYRKAVLASAVASAILAGAPALAQAMQPAAPPVDGDPKAQAVDRDAAERIADLDQVVVVGSRFAGNNEAGMVPVEVMDQEEIEATGAVSGEELLRSLPQ